MDLHPLAYPGVLPIYKIDEDGNVYNTSTNRYVRHTVRCHHPYVAIIINGTLQPVPVARLVAATFIGIENGYVIHEDGNRMNNNRHNLRYGTKSEIAIAGHKGINRPWENTMSTGREIKTAPREKQILATNGNVQTKYSSIASAARSCGIYEKAISRSLKSGKMYMGIKFEAI